MHAVNTFIGSELISRVDLLPPRTPELCYKTTGTVECLQEPMTKKESMLFGGLLTMMFIKGWLFYEMINVEKELNQDTLRINFKESPIENTRTHILKKSKTVLSLVQSLVNFVEELSSLDFW